MPCSRELPGLRDHSSAEPSHGGHGIDEIRDVVHQLAAVGAPSCVVGVRALRYYGAARITNEWDLCIPDDKLEAARSLLLAGNGDVKYEAARPPPPVPWSRRHALPCVRHKRYNFWFILWPSSDCFVNPSRADHVETSMNGVPYASLVQFARPLLLQQLTPDIADFIDGMNLTVDWGAQNIGFEALQEASAKFIEKRNQRVENDDQGQSSGARCGCLSPQFMERLWNESARQEAKDGRIEPMKQGRYFTRWRRVRSPEDPRTRNRPV